MIREPAAPCLCPAHGTEFVRWVQSSLNQILGLRLPVNGVMNRATRNALRDFQKRQGLPTDGIAGPETEKVLVEAKEKLSGRTASSLRELEDLGTLDLNLADIESEDVGNSDLMFLEFDDQQEFERKARQCPTPCHPFPPPRGYGGYYVLRNGHRWFTPVYKQYPTNPWHLAEAVQTLMLESNDFDYSKVPSQKDIRYAIKVHNCNKHFTRRKPMFIPRFGPDRCTGNGNYYGSIYIPFKW